MTKENAKDFLPLVQALADGKTIQYFVDDKWEDVNSVSFHYDVERYRIKPEEEYVPFDTVEELIECWNQKKFNGNPPYNTGLELPLIWVKKKYANEKGLITGFDNDSVIINGFDYVCEELFENCTFLDGSPIGKIKE